MLVRSLSQPAAAPKAPATVQEPALQHRPPVDWWEVGARRFDSTADLIASDAVTEAGSPARYHFQTEVPDGSQSGPGNVAGGALAGAAIGAGVAAGGMVALEVLGELANILLSGPYYSASGGFSGGAYLSVAAAAAAAGAVGGALLVRAGGESLAERGYAVDGTVRRENGSQNVFYPGSRVTDGVDLDGYAQAPDLPEPVVSQRPWWKDSLQGAGVGAVTPLSACIPLIGLFAPAVLGGQVGSALSRGQLYGGVLGAAAGLGVTVGTYAAISAGGFLPFAGLTAGTAALGAAVGPFAAPRMRQEAAREEQLSGQWWYQQHRAQSDA